jgi:hypothetical protein
MNEQETKAVLIAILETLREQAIYLHRQHGWLIAVAESLAGDSGERLKQHPFYDQGPRQDVDKTHATIRQIDALIQQLKDRN